ncbi:MAG: hypothetical protein Q8Q35_00115 [Nanoarchaeota archaeon]|nr:hypothetical protein [Nanoarchaeota archaeon]
MTDKQELKRRAHTLFKAYTTPSKSLVPEEHQGGTLIDLSKVVESIYYGNDFGSKIILGDLFDIDTSDVQYMLDAVEEFTQYGSAFSDYYGLFLSQLVHRSFPMSTRCHRLDLTTRNSNPVHISEHFVRDGIETSFPSIGTTKLYEYYTSQGLISNFPQGLGNCIEVNIEGNLGAFFAFENNGANVTLNGECGWRPVYGIKSGVVTINGAVGHYLAESAGGGSIHVNGVLRTLGIYTTSYKHEISHNGKLLPKENP